MKHKHCSGKELIIGRQREQNRRQQERNNVKKHLELLNNLRNIVSERRLGR